MTDYSDPVFPLPTPDFLWVHDLSIRKHSASTIVTDSDGNWAYADDQWVTFTGYITAPNPREVDLAASRSIVLDAVTLAPHGVGVDVDDEIDSSGANCPSILKGRYTVNTVRPNPSHVRVLLTRIQGQESTHAP